MPQQIFNCAYCLNMSFVANDNDPVTFNLQLQYDEQNELYTGETYGINFTIFYQNDIWTIDFQEESITQIMATGSTCDCPTECQWVVNTELDTTIEDLLITSCFTTTTTTIPTPPTPIEPTNECDVLTIFPMEVNCFTTQPTFSDTYDGAAALGITGGTPPYTIIWKDGSVAPAKFNLGPGEYEATVTDYYGDFTISTVCVLTAETTTTTTTVLPTTTQIQYKDYCMAIDVAVFKNVTTQFEQLTYNGEYNGYPSWESTPSGYLIYWTGDTINAWVVSGTTNGTIFNNSYNDTTTNQPLPLSNWNVIGSSGPINRIEKVRMVEGDCDSINIPRLTVNKNDTTCGCDGSITLSATNGQTPYEYSINGGITYQPTPVFQNLCTGQYTAYVRDYSGFTNGQLVVITGNTSPTVYDLKLINTTPTSFEITTTPTLPIGVSVTFDLSHLSSLTKQPAISTQTYNNTVTLLKNSIVVPPTGAPITTTTPQPLIGPCSVTGRVKTETTTNWSNITLSSGDVITGTFTNSFNVPTPIPSCYAPPITSTKMLISGITQISGCDCCEFTIINPIIQTL